MATIAKQIADNASYQAFVNGYLKEIDEGVWHSIVQWKTASGFNTENHDKFMLELQLQHSEIKLVFGVAFRSIVGRHKLTGIYHQRPNSMEWHPLDSISAIMLLIKEIYAWSNTPHVCEQELELTSRTIESHQVMADYVQERKDDPALKSPRFIDSEQSVLFGHWLHPTPKSRQGMHRWQHAHYAPELKGSFKLHFFAVERKWLNQSSAIELCAEHIVLRIAEQDAGDEQVTLIKQFSEAGKALVAVHPLQAEWLLKQDYIHQLISTGQLHPLGPLGAKFTPTSSVRTLYCEKLNFMVKVSIPVKITNSMRVNMGHELDAGVTLAKLLNTTRFSSLHSQFQVIGDPAYLSLSLPDMDESGFEMILRDNPFKQTEKELGIGGIQSIAALVQDAILPNDRSKLATIIHTLSVQEGRSEHQTSIAWFDRYWQCAIEPAIRLFDQFGIALEAHQQNSLLDLTEGYPKTYFYRDNQGFYLSSSVKSTLLQLEPDLIKCPDLFYDNDMIFDRFGYYLIINQLFSVINRFGLDGLVSEDTLLNLARIKLDKLLTQVSSLGQGLIRSITERKSIPCKGNLLTRVDDVDELQAEMEQAVYTQIKNPFYCLTPPVSLPNNPATTFEVCLESA